MRTLSPLTAIGALLLTAASLPIVGGVLFALFLFFPLFLLGLVTVLAGLEDRTVREHSNSMSATSWRDGSAAVHPLDLTLQIIRPSMGVARREIGGHEGLESRHRTDAEPDAVSPLS